MELHPPKLSWKNGTPHSDTYGDIYYMIEDGLAEARHVFLHGNNLPERMRNRPASLVIGETGFGTGLNFLALWQEWADLPPPRPRLHYISTELYPLTVGDLQQAHARWPELKPFSAELLAAWPPAIAGPHRRWLADGMIQLDLLWGDATKMLKRFQSADEAIPVDAWFLDGFAPSGNPEMWHPPLYEVLAKLSHAKTTLATFTAAGEVRRGLQAAGFTVEKKPGYGRKRDMTAGRITSRNAPRQSPAEAIVIGAGIAGVTAAWRLAKQGTHVTLLEAGTMLCAGASGNPASALTPYYPAQWNIRGRMLASGFATTRHLLKYLRRRGHAIAGSDTGTLMLNLDDGNPRGARLSRWQHSLTLPPEIRREVTANEADQIAGISLGRDGWFYPQGGWMNMRDFCAALLADAEDRITLRLNTRATSCTHAGHHWQIGSETDDVLSTPAVVIAAAHAATALIPELTLNVVHGQTLSFTAPPEMQPLHCVVNAGHTLIPLGNNRMSWGSSFRYDESKPHAIEAEAERLLRDLQHLFPGLDTDVLRPALTPWAGLRCTHPSRLPLIGPVPGHPSGLYLHLAHGARGALSATLPFSAANFADT